MYKYCAHQSSICSILPPFILDRVARNAPPKSSSAAAGTLAIDKTFRVRRRSRHQEALASAPRAAAAAVVKSITIYNANNTQTLPGTLVRRTGNPAVSDDPANEAFDGLDTTYDFYWSIYQRNSLDDGGLPLKASVHYGTDYNNAFWDGKQMVFGDGDGETFNGFTGSIDIIAHELTHGVTQNEARLLYFFEPGALNESVSDVFGSMVKQYQLKQTAESADWLIGEGIFAEGINGRALRDMKNPGTAFDDPVVGKDQQPGHMDDYVLTLTDSGGVHINSGIPNRAFCLSAINIGGHSWEKAGRIWYETLVDERLYSISGFRQFATLTVNNAEMLYGASSNEVKGVRDAWAEVGIVSTTSRRRRFTGRRSELYAY